MELKHLQALLGIADTGSFSAAADLIGTVQSNISAHVARLERELEVGLVDRSSGRLTEEGEVVAARARRIMGEIDAMVADVVSLREEVVGSVQLGLIGTTGRWLVPQLFGRLGRDHPHVHLFVADGTSSTLEPQVASGALDLAVVSLPLTGDDLVAQPLFEEDLVLVLPSDHPLVEKACRQPRIPSEFQEDPSFIYPCDPLPLSVLSELEMLLPQAGTVLRAEIDTAASLAGVTLRPSLELDGLRMIASLVFDGYGPAILPASAVPAHLRERFSLLPLKGLPRRQVGIATRRHGRPSAPARALIEVVSAVINDPESVPGGLHASHETSRRPLRR